MDDSALIVSYLQEKLGKNLLGFTEDYRHWELASWTGLTFPQYPFYPNKKARTRGPSLNQVQFINLRGLVTRSLVPGRHAVIRR